MKLDTKEFTRFKELEKLVKAKKASAEETAEYKKLYDKRNAKPGNKGNGFGPGNDFPWWNKIPELIRDSASFKCNWVPGSDIAPGAFNYEGVGVMTIELDSVLGSNTAVTDPVNIWARDLYLRMFQKYRPVSNYSSSDLGIAILGGVEAVKLVATYERIYGVINRYSKLNVNMPKTEADALGLSSTQLKYLQGHMSDFRYDLNYLIRKAQRLCIPKDLSIVAQAIALFGFEYMDHESIRSQFIFFKQHDYGVYSDTALTSGGSIEYKDLVTMFDFSQDNMCVALAEVLDALLGSDSVQRIFADLVVWFGEAAMLQFVPVPEEYVVAPVKSESILHEIHNLTTFEDSSYRLTSFVDAALATADQNVVQGSHRIYQCDDRIVTSLCAIRVPTGAAVSYTNERIHGINGFLAYSSGSPCRSLELGHVIDTAHLDITPDLIVEGTIFQFVSTPKTLNSTYSQLIDSTTFYIVRGIRLWRNTTGGTSYYLNCTTSPSQASMAAGELACIDWAPLCFYLDTIGTLKGSSAIYGDYDNIVFISNADETRIHRTIVLSGLETSVTVVNK